MSELNWEKPTVAAASPAQTVDKLKFIVVGVILVGIVGFLLISGTASGGRYFMTVDSLLTRPDLVGKTVKISGAVVGPTIQTDSNVQAVTFTVAQISDDVRLLEEAGGLAKALHTAVTDTSAKRLNIVVKNQPKPDLLQDEAQAILTGSLGADGVFYADTIELKCPSKYQADVPKQT